MKIRDRDIGYDQPTYFVAEISANHLGNKALAVELIQSAAQAGADAVKFQLYYPSNFCDDTADPLWDFYEQWRTPPEWFPELKCIATGLDMAFIVSPFGDPAHVDVLEGVAPHAYKVGFSEFYNVPMLERIRATGRPVIASTGMATWDDVAEVDRLFPHFEGHHIAYLHCVSGYPTPSDSMNMARLRELMDYFWGECPVGLSEHTTTTHFSLAAAVAGACIIERHFIKQRNGVSPDNGFSLEPDELAGLIREVREVEAAFGQCDYGILPCEQEFAWRKERSQQR